MIMDLYVKGDGGVATQQTWLAVIKDLCVCVGVGGGCSVQEG